MHPLGDLKDNKPIAWFADTPSQGDLRILKSTTGDPAFNTVWEAFAILVALRAWWRARGL